MFKKIINYYYKKRALKYTFDVMYYEMMVKYSQKKRDYFIEKYN